MKKDNIIYITSSAGALAGLGFAFKQKKSFWGYVGYFVLGSIVGSLVGNVIGFSKSSDTDDSEQKKIPELEATMLPPSKTDLVMPKNIQSLRNRVRNITPTVNE